MNSNEMKVLGIYSPLHYGGFERSSNMNKSLVEICHNRSNHDQVMAQTLANPPETYHSKRTQVIATQQLFNCYTYIAPSSPPELDSDHDLWP